MRNEYVDRVQGALDESNRESQDLEARYRHLHANQEVDKQVKELRAIRRELERQVEECEKTRDEQAWEGLRIAIDDGLQLLKRATDAFERTLKRLSD